MTIAEEFIKKLQDATGKEPFSKKFWQDYDGHSGTTTFQKFLENYAEYYKSLTDDLQKTTLSEIFWEQVKAVGTPIIEDRSDGQCDVYFLFPKNKISESEAKEAKKGTKKNLYLQGDFHGYNAIRDQQKLSELSDTGIMWRQDSMPKDSIVVYQYVQAEPGHHIKPEPDISPFFNDDKTFAFRESKTNDAKSPNVPQSGSKDDYSNHNFPYPGFDWGERVFRVSADHSYIPGKPIDWPSLLDTEILDVEMKSAATNFVYHATLYSDQAGDLHRVATPVTKQYHDDLHYANGYHLSLKEIPSFNALDTTKLGEKPYLLKDELGHYKIWGDKGGTWQLTDITWELTSIKDMDSLKIPSEWMPNQTIFISSTDAVFDILKKGHTPYLPYADFTRNIQVFKPTSGKIDNIVVVNDGIPYLLTGILDHFEKMVSDKKISPNTALVFVNTLSGLRTTLFPDLATKYDQDPSANNPGMGVRLIDYKHGIDQYIDFIDKKLFPQLKEEGISVPDDDPSHRVMIGSSLSGTAGVYVGLKRPDLFGTVIAQSPSSDNREILSRIPREKITGKNIHLSCGQFEHPDFAAANDFLDYAKELAQRLGIKLDAGNHGHQFVAWVEKLEQSLPAVLPAPKPAASELKQQRDSKETVPLSGTAQAVTRLGVSQLALVSDDHMTDKSGESAELKLDAAQSDSAQSTQLKDIDSSDREKHKALEQESAITKKHRH